MRTDSKHPPPGSPNVLARQFDKALRKQAWGLPLSQQAMQRLLMTYQPCRAGSQIFLDIYH